MATNCKQICKIDYSRSIAAIVGDGGALLVGMVRSWCRVMKREIWKSNDEIMQELGMGRYQFERARSAIATRVKSGDSKKELQRVRMEDGSLAPINRVILYWKDRANRMWYWVNEELFAAYAGIPYGLQVVEAKGVQTIEDVEAEGKDQQTIKQEHEKQELSEEKDFSFAFEGREELKCADDWRWEHVRALCKVPREIRLKGIEGDVWRVEGVHDAYTGLRTLQAQIRQQFGGVLDYQVRGVGVPAWA